MHVLVPVLLLSVLPQGTAQKPPKTGRLTLPPTSVKKRTQQPPRPQARNDLDQFHRDVIDLRRSKVLKPNAEEMVLRNLRVHYDDPALMAVQLAARCKNDLLFGLMKVVDRYGDKYHAEQLHFQVLTRPMGRVTNRVVRTIVQKSGDRAKGYLFDYLLARYSPVRKAAVEMLPSFLDEADVPRLIMLSHERKTDVRRKVIDLLGRVQSPKVRERLVQVMQQDPAVAADACAAAVRHGASIVPQLAGIVRKPPRNRAFGYAAFALTQIEKSTGDQLLTDDMVPHLVQQLRSSDSLSRSTSSIALATLAHRSGGLEGQGSLDGKIVEALLDLVAPEKFITSLQMLQPAAAEVLVKFSGRDFKSRGKAWRGWWDDAKSDFVSLRKKLSVTLENAELAHVKWEADDYFLSFRGAKVEAKSVPAESVAYLLTAEQMVALVQRLEGEGFMGNLELPRTPDVWRLDLQIAGARAMQRLGRETGRAFHRALADVARTEMWQKYRDPEAQPDAAAFWRSERKWLAEHPNRESERLVWHVLRRLPKLDPKARDAALTDLQSVPGLPKLVTDDDARVMIALAKKIPKFEKGDIRLLEMALLAPGETNWKRVLEVLEGRTSGAGNEFASRVFRLLGPERVVTAIRHPNRHIAVAAMHDAAAQSNQAAVPMLLTRVSESDSAMQRTAVYTLGVLHAVQARDQLIEMEAKAHPAVRREIWKALGRIGGKTVPAILQRAMEEPDIDDKMAALTAMGFTQSPEMARFLATRYAMQGSAPDAFSQRAELSLRRIGPLLAIPALRPHLQMQDGPARHRLILLLGEFQDARVVRELIDLLRDRRNEFLATRFLEEITGVDLRSIDDRVRAMYAWYADNKIRPRGEWYLAALRRKQIRTSLQPSNLTPRSGVGAVEELARLLTIVTELQMRMMTATMLRETTGMDFTAGIRHAEATTVAAIADRYRIHAATVRAAAK